MTRLKTREVLSAYSGDVIGEVPVSGASEVEELLQSASDLYANKLSWLPTSTRIEILHSAASIMARRHMELTLLIAGEGGKPFKDAVVEVDRAIDGLNICAEELRKEGGNVIPMRVNPASAGRLAVTQFQPIGVVVAVSAFNHPLNLIVHQAGPAVASGCPVIIKPAKHTPMCAHAFADILKEAGLPEGWCRVVNTDSTAESEQLVTDPRISFFSFIGSPSVGWSLKSKLAPGVRCALEHGGAAPALVMADADLSLTTSSLLKGGFYHAGQVCVSVQRIFADEAVADDLIASLDAQAANLVVGDPSKAETDVGPLIRPVEVERVDSWVREAVDGGATLVRGGNAITERVYEPTILADPLVDSKIAKQEVFGPVIAVFRTKSTEEAIARANDIDFAFQAAVFTQDIDNAMAAYSGLNASAVMVNDHTAFRTDWMPFVGLGQSGHGVGGMPYTLHDMRIEKMLVLKSPALENF